MSGDRGNGWLRAFAAMSTREEIEAGSSPRPERGVSQKNRDAIGFSLRSTCPETTVPLV